MIAEICLYLLFNILASIEGFKEAALFAMKGPRSFKWDIHRLFDVERFVIAAICVTCTFINWHQVSIILLSAIVSFPFFHDGFYFIGRNIIDKPDYNFFSYSKGSTSKIELSFPYRLSFQIISILIFILLFRIT